MARRNWGSGGIFQVGPRTWRVAIPLGSDAFGKRQRKAWEYTGPDAKARAEAKLRDVSRRLDRGAPLEESRMTLGVYVPEWLAAQQGTVKPSTYEQRRSLAEVHLDELGPYPLSRIGASDIRSLLQSRLKEGYATRTVRGILDVLRMILKQAHEDGHVERNVAEFVKPPKLEQAEPQHFTPEQVRRFLDAISADPLASLYAVGLGTGLRRGELLRLHWRDVDLELRMVTVRQAKTSAGVRTVPLPNFAVVHLSARDRSPGPIWPVSPSWVTHHFADLCRKAGVPVLTFHSTRHTFASMLLDQGVDPLTIQALLGHAKPSMSAWYARSGEGLRREAVDRLEKAIGG